MSMTFLRAGALAAALAVPLMPALAAGFAEHLPARLATPPSTTEALSLAQALELAAQRSEAARAGRAAARGADESARAAGQLPDPMLRAGIENLPVTGAERFSTTRESMTMKRIGISQEWLARSKRAARERAAKAAAERDAADIGAAESEARLNAALAYIDAWYADAALKLALEGEHHVHEQLAGARAMLASAAGNSTEVLQLTSAQGIAEDDRAEAAQQQAAAFLALQRWVGFVPSALGAAPSIEVPTEDEYLARHPTLATLQREVELARQNAAVAAQERTPNWTWEVAYGQRSGYSDLVSVGASVPWPVAPAQRQDRETAAKLALIDKAEAELSEATRAAMADYRAMASDATRLQQRIGRYETAVLTPAQQRTAAALAAYRSNQGPLAAVFEARHMEVEARRKVLALQRELAKAQAQLAFKPLVQGGGQ